MLTKEEILENWNMFVGSQATNYGEDLTRNHDELWSRAKGVELSLRTQVLNWELNLRGIHEAMPVTDELTDVLQLYLTDWT